MTTFQDEYFNGWVRPTGTSSTKPLFVRVLAGGAIFVLLAMLIVPMFPGGWPRWIIETLDAPVEVVAWDTDGLVLKDGRTVMPAGLQKLPAVSEALALATERGVEVNADGRVFGLVRIHHWCGNDPVRRHIVRVDLGLLLEYLGEGQATAPPVPWSGYTQAENSQSFTDRGWRIDNYVMFPHWCETVATARSSYAELAGPPRLGSGWLDPGVAVGDHPRTMRNPPAP